MWIGNVADKVPIYMLSDGIWKTMLRVTALLKEKAASSFRRKKSAKHHREKHWKFFYHDSSLAISEKLQILHFLFLHLARWRFMLLENITQIINFGDMNRFFNLSTSTWSSKDLIEKAGKRRRPCRRQMLLDLFILLREL